MDRIAGYLTYGNLYLFTTHMTRNKWIAVAAVVVVVVGGGGFWLMRRRRANA